VKVPVTVYVLVAANIFVLTVHVPSETLMESLAVAGDELVPAPIMAAPINTRKRKPMHIAAQNKNPCCFFGIAVVDDGGIMADDVGLILGGIFF
jgi:hypothetical protein